MVAGALSVRMWTGAVTMQRWPVMNWDWRLSLFTPFFLLESKPYYLYVCVL